MGYVKSLLILIVIVVIMGISSVSAEPWQKTVDFGFNLTQNSYSDSWTGGEAGNITWVSKIDAMFEKQMSPKFNFKNTSKLQFGQTHIQDKETKDWQKPQKSTDKIDIENLGRFTLNTFVDPYVAFRLESQFLDASVDSVKRYFNPLLLTESAGVAKVFYEKDKDQVLSRLGFSIRQQMNKEIISVDPNEFETKTTNDGGIESVTDANFIFSESLTYTGKLSIFKALYYSEKDEFVGTAAEDYWKAVDINFENTISATVTKYVSVSLYMQLLYDKQVDVRGRLKETLGLGLTYKFL
jgi:hypothetical protein